MVRGFALLGVFMVNMLFFAQPMESHFLRPLSVHPSPGEYVALLVLAQGKFYSLFSFLFGLGFAVQLHRLEGRGEDGPRWYRRRLTVLLALGLAHGILIWSGDILAMYALYGFALLAFRASAPRTIRTWILGLLGGLALLFLISGILLVVASHLAPQEMAKASAEQIQSTEQAIQASLQAYAKGPFATLFRQRLKDLAHNYAFTTLVAPQIFSMFLLGLLAFRTGWLEEGPEARGRLRRMAIWGFGLGFPLNLVHVALESRGLPGPGNPWGVMGMAAYLPAATLISLAYAAALVLALRGGRAPWLRALAWPGRMALSCYLGHALVFTLVFNAYGLRLYGKVGLGPALLMAIALWLAMIPLCRVWLSRFRLGPAEWVWRSLTYGRAQAFRI